MVFLPRGSRNSSQKAFRQASTCSSESRGPSAASGGPATVTETTLHGRSALTLSNGSMSMSVLPGGGFIGAVHLTTGDPRADINPMRVPDYQTIDPHTFDPENEAHAAAYGTDVQGRLMSGYMGHYTCFPQFGSSPEEFKAVGYGQHGEAIDVLWERQATSTSSGQLSMTAHLPLNSYNFRRTITMLPGETVAYVTETAENLTSFERPLQWNQHVTFGPPFVEVGKLWADASVVDAPADFRAFSGSTSRWQMQNQKPQNWVTAFNENYRLLFGQLFDAELNPWLLDWQTDAASSDQRSMPVPLRGATARGFCWGDSVESGIKNAVKTTEHNGVPTYSWIGARQCRSQNYAIFLAELPERWCGTADVSVCGGRIVITEMASETAVDARTITLRAEGI
jgi:hypothetical protein